MIFNEEGLTKTIILMYMIIFDKSLRTKTNFKEKSLTAKETTFLFFIFLQNH